MRHRPKVVGRSNLLPSPHLQRGWPSAALRDSATNGPDRDGYTLSRPWSWITSQLHPQRGGTR